MSFLTFPVIYGPYWLHLKEAWKQRDHPNLHFMFYEDLKQNNMEELKRLDNFLGTKLTQEQLENVCNGDVLASQPGWLNAYLSMPWLEPFNMHTFLFKVVDQVENK